MIAPINSQNLINLDDNPLFKHWPDGLIAIDHQGHIIAISESATQLFNWTIEEIRGKKPHHVLCVETRESAHSEDECPLSNRASHSDDSGSLFQSSTWAKSDGNYFSVDFRIIEFSLNDIAYLISFIDNDDRLHNQAEMEKFTAYAESNPSPIAEFDTFGQLLFGNTAMGNLLDKYDFDEEGQARVLPKNTDDICEAICTATTTDIDSTNSITIAETHIEDRYFNWHFQPLHTSEGVSVMGYAFDVTDEKLALEQAEQQKNQSRKEFFAKMVHELRTPLNAIVGFSNILLSRAAKKLSDHELQRLQAIKTAGLQLNELVTNTLDFSKIESGKMSLDVSEFSILEVCEALHEQMLTLAQQKGLEYKFTSLTEKTICSDKTKIRQIIINLVSNAIKYTPEGKVNLMLSETLDDEMGECFQIVVLDTGMGIPKENIPTLFDSFEQVENKQSRDIQGTGLGLALVKDFTQLLGGKISVTSTLGEGSSFELLLPYSKFDEQQ